MGNWEIEKDEYIIALKFSKLGTYHVLTALGSIEICKRGQFLRQY